MSKKDKKAMKRLMISLFAAGMKALSNDAEYDDDMRIYLHNIGHQIFLNTEKDGEEHHDLIIELAEKMTSRQI